MKLRWTRRKREKGWTCTGVQQYWDEYTENELSVRDKFEYEAHLAKCEKCQDFIHFLKYENPAITGAARAVIRARPIPSIPKKLTDAAEKLPIEGKLRLIEFAQEAEDEDRLREEKRRRREMEREKAEKAKPS